MPVATNGQNLLEAVKNMTAQEFNVFLDKAFSIRANPKTVLSPQETRLIKRINRPLPASLIERSASLRQRMKAGTLTADEHKELLRLTERAELQDGERAGALLELAELRGVPVRVVMKQMGIQAAPIHG